MGWNESFTSISGTKQAFLATGCVGTNSWEIGNTGNILVVMYSVPFDHNLYSNWCGVGIFKKQDSISHLFDTMYYEKETTCFARKEFKVVSMLKSMGFTQLQIRKLLPKLTEHELHVLSMVRKRNKTIARKVFKCNLVY